MFRLNLKIAWRNLWKNKGYTFINIAGLSIGLASCMLIFIFINYQMSFDKDFKNEDKIYRIVTNWSYPGYNEFQKGVPIPVIASSRNEIAGFEKVAGILERGGMIHVKDVSGNDLIKSKEVVYYAEPEFFDIFDMYWVFGIPKQALAEPNTAALSEGMAKKLFGSTSNAVGKSFTYNNTNLKITGVFKDRPVNSSFHLNIVISFRTFSGSTNAVDWTGVNSSMECYVLLKKGMKAADLDEQLAHFNKTHYQDKGAPGKQANVLQPLNDIHFNADYGNFAESSITKKDIYGLAVIGLFLILTACINFINLATAQSIGRSKEVGVRKVMGSRRKELVLQFLTETFVTTVIAMLVACVLTEMTLPLMKHLFKEDISFSLFRQPEIFAFIGILIVLVSFLAGFYPALVMSGFSPALAIKNRVIANSGNLSLRKVLVVLQFAITIILIISTLVIMKQMQYFREKPLGFASDAVSLIDMPSDSLSRLKYNTFRERVMQVPGVAMVSFCKMAPLSDQVRTSDFSYNGKRNTEFEIRNYKADENYLGLFDLKLVAGKVFNKAEVTSGCIVNETFLKKMNISDPQEVIGKILNVNESDKVITGVVKDFNDKSLKETISPLVIYPEKEAYDAVAVKIDSKQLVPAMKMINRLWNNTYPNYIYDADFVEDSIAGYYENERITGTLFNVFTGVIIFISFIGLFGLISFVATQRTREVAIRKVLGASTFELVKMLNSSFLVMVLIANLVAWPIAYLFTSYWLAGFAYRIDLSIWPFVLAFVISILIALITTSIKSYRTATGKTIDALKYE